MPLKIMARVFSNDGSPRVNEFQVNYLQDAALNYLSLGALSNADVVVTWSSSGQTSSSGSTFIFVQQLSPSGSFVGSPFQVTSFSSGENTEPSIAGLANGRFVVSWTMQVGLANPTVFFQLFNSQQTPYKQGSFSLKSGNNPQRLHLLLV
jgi:large repetitive protein